MFTRVLILAALLCGTIQAQTTTVADVTGLSPGTYLLTITADSATTTPLKILGSKPGPVVPPVPPTPGLTDRGIAMRTAALLVNDPNRAKTAEDLSDLYHEIAKMVRAGTIKGGQAVIARVVSFGTDKVLSEDGSPGAAWKPVRDVFGKYWVKLAQEAAPDESFCKLLDEAGDGLMSTVPPQQTSSAQARQVNIAKIIEIIMAILKLLGLIP